MVEIFLSSKFSWIGGTSSTSSLTITGGRNCVNFSNTGTGGSGGGGGNSSSGFAGGIVLTSTGFISMTSSGILLRYAKMPKESASVATKLTKIITIRLS